MADLERLQREEDARKRLCKAVRQAFKAGQRGWCYEHDLDREISRDAWMDISVLLGVDVRWPDDGT